MKKYTSFLIIVITFFACSNSETEKVKINVEENNPKSKILEYIEREVVSDSTNNQRIRKIDDEFSESFSRFTNSIKHKAGSITNESIHSEFGLYIIETVGAMPSMNKIYSSDKLFYHQAFKIFLTQDLALLVQEPIFESLPKVICDTTIFDKQGCFAAQKNMLLESRIWNYSNLNEKQIQAIESLAETVKMTVINTSNFTFYFSKIEGKWYLTFLDVRIPCTA